MITEDYVSFETAKLLKEKGFDESCTHVYNIEKRKRLEADFYTCRYVYNSWLDKNESQLIAAPTLQMAMKWLREQNKIISILHSYVTNKYKIIITQFNKLDIANLNNTLYSSNDYDYFSYEEACETAIRYCLENLI